MASPALSNVWKVRPVVDVTDPAFAAKGDSGATTNTVPIQAAANSTPYGGIMFVPTGKYKVDDEITLHAGLTVHGEGAADFMFGAPPAPNSVPSFIYQTSNNKAIFVLTGGMHNVTIANLALSSALVPAITGAPDVTGKIGIKLQDSYPHFVWTLMFHNIMFYTLERGISCVDPNAGTNAPPYNYDWSVAPVDVSNCRFMYTKYGVYISTNNADDWVFERCNFNVGNGGAGIYLYRAGMMHVIRSFAGGASINGNTFLWIEGNGGVNNDAFGIDNVVLDGCQAETLTHFIVVNTRGANNAYTYAPTVHCRNCVAELGADVYLANRCHFISEGCRWAIPLYGDGLNVKISSILDYFDAVLPARWYILSGDERNYVQTIKLGPFPPSGPPLMANAAHIENGVAWKYDGAAPVAGQWYKNDRILNSAPAVGQPKAWLCTVSGTPGTWVSEGNL